MFPPLASVPGGNVSFSLQMNKFAFTGQNKLEINGSLPCDTSIRIGIPRWLYESSILKGIECSSLKDRSRTFNNARWYLRISGMV